VREWSGLKVKETNNSSQIMPLPISQSIISDHLSPQYRPPPIQHPLTRTLWKAKFCNQQKLKVTTVLEKFF